MLASGSTIAGGCVDRAYDFGYVGPDTDTDADTDFTTGATTGDPTVDPSDPTVGPSDPTVDPTDPTGQLPGIPGPPQLLEVRFLDDTTLELRFNEPMAPPIGVDPTQFRLSRGLGQMQNYLYGTFTFYEEIGQFNGGEGCWEYCYGGACYEYCYPIPGPSVHASIVQIDYGYSDRIRIGLDQIIQGSLCGALGPSPEQITVGLFLHYTDDGAPVTDAQGEPLPPIGERWALSPDESFYYVPQAFFPDLVPLLPIPCPF